MTPSLLPKSRRQRITFMIAGTVVLIAITVLAFLLFPRRQPPTMRTEIGTPLFATEALVPGILFTSAPALAFLRAHRPTLLKNTELTQESAVQRQFEQALQNPTLWRELDRRLRFDAVFLAGNPATFRPLLQHLVKATDWRLTYLDHTSLIFKRAPVEAWSPSQLEAIQARVADYAPLDRLRFFLGLADKLRSVNEVSLARAYLEDASQLQPNEAEVWHAIALCHVQNREWPEALDQIDRALRLQPKLASALVVKAEILFSMRRYNDAFAISETLVEKASQDPQFLFFHARLAHQAHAYRSEIEALKKLIALAQREGETVAGYQIYLAQAYAADSQAAPALEQFEAALGDKNISEEQRKFVQESIDRIRSRVSL